MRFSKFGTVVAALLGHCVASTAPCVAAIAVLLTPKGATALPRWAAWYDTPDEAGLVGLYEPRVQWMHDHLGWRLAAWYWFGMRNKAHGFQSIFSVVADRHWDDGWDLSSGFTSYFAKSRSGAWIGTRRYGPVITAFGWQVYASPRFASGLEYRPVMTLKLRPPKN